MEFRTCTFICDDGNICNSAAVTDRNLCLFHLSHRARLMRMAQYRARGERFDLTLPPLESMHAVQSALTQLSEALAADMIELKRADRLIRVLNIASRNLLKSDKWPASPYHSARGGDQLEDAPPLSPAVGDRVGPIDLTAKYGLPNDLDLNLSPELAFPPSVILSGGGAPFAPPESKDPFFAQHRVGGMGAPPLSPFFGDRVGATDNRQPATDNCSPMPTVAYCQHGPGCPEHTIRADYPETAEIAELREIKATQGMDAAVERYKQQQRNQRRRYIVTSRKRYAAIAPRNYAPRRRSQGEQKLAEKLAQESLAGRKPPLPLRGRESIAPRRKPPPDLTPALMHMSEPNSD